MNKNRFTVLLVDWKFVIAIALLLIVTALLLRHLVI